MLEICFWRVAPETDFGIGFVELSLIKQNRMAEKRDI